MLADPTNKNKRSHYKPDVPSPETNVRDRVTDSHRESSTSRPIV